MQCILYGNAGGFVPQSTFQFSPDCVAVENQFSFSSQYAMQVLFSKGKHLRSIDELWFVDPIVTGAFKWQNLVTMTRKYLKIHHHDAKSDDKGDDLLRVQVDI